MAFDEWTDGRVSFSDFYHRNAICFNSFLVNFLIFQLNDHEYKKNA